MDGSAFRGLGTVFAFGLAAIQITWLLAPPAVVACGYWLIAPRLGWTLTWLQVFLAVAAVWGVANVLGFVVGWLGAAFSSWRSERRHAEFMRLRAMFYASNEVCLDDLQTLRARAADRTGDHA